MLVSNRMTSYPITIGKHEPLDAALQIMHDKNIRHIPVVDSGALLGLLSYSDIMKAMPSKINTLERHEATYLFSTIKVKDAIPDNQNIITIRETACIEEAALMMRSYKIGSLPVVDGKSHLVGIITESDIFDAFIDLMGVRSSGSRVTVEVKNEPGQIAEVAEVVSKFHANITKIAMFSKEDGTYSMIVRMKGADVHPIVEALKVHGYNVIEVADYSGSQSSI